MRLLTVENLRVRFAGTGDEVVAVDDLSFALDAGQCVAIIGE